MTEEANAWYLDLMTELLGDSLFTLGNCASARSYYFNPSGEAALLRPMMTTRRAVAEASRFPLSDMHCLIRGSSMADQKNDSTLAKLVGLGVAGAGMYFVKPQLFESITKSAFPGTQRAHLHQRQHRDRARPRPARPQDHQARHRQTLGYVAYLAGNAVRNR